MKQAKKGKRIPSRSAAIPPTKGATVEPTNQEMFVQPYADAMVSLDEASATIVHRRGMYKPMANPDSITQGTKSSQLLASAYINGGKEASKVPSACNRFLPYLSDRNPMGI